MVVLMVIKWLVSRTHRSQ